MHPVNGLIRVSCSTARARRSTFLNGRPNPARAGDGRPDAAWTGGMAMANGQLKRILRRRPELDEADDELHERVRSRLLRLPFETTDVAPTSTAAGDAIADGLSAPAADDGTSTTIVVVDGPGDLYQLPGPRSASWRATTTGCGKTGTQAGPGRRDRAARPSTCHHSFGAERLAARPRPPSGPRDEGIRDGRSFSLARSADATMEILDRVAPASDP